VLTTEYKVSLRLRFGQVLGARSSRLFAAQNRFKATFLKRPVFEGDIAQRTRSQSWLGSG
jgi:hypothetical protein